MSDAAPPTDRLTRMIARLETQRRCLDFAAAALAEIPGPVLEVGLGKGRTYDRLRALFPDRAIYAFDRDIHCPPELVPADGHLFLGDFRATLPAAAARLGRTAALAHADFGTSDRARDAALALALAPLLDALVAPGGLVLSDRAMADQGWRTLSLSEGAGTWPYFIYRVD